MTPFWRCNRRWRAGIPWSPSWAMGQWALCSGRGRCASIGPSPSSCYGPISPVVRDIRERFLREARTAAQLYHPNIVPIYLADEVDGLSFFVMACVDGETLGPAGGTEGATRPGRSGSTAALHLLGPGVRPRPRGGAPRHQAREHPDRPGKPAAARRRLRHRAGQPRSRQHARRGDRGYARVHEPGTVRRRHARRSKRPLLAGNHRLLHPHGRRAVQWS